MKYEMMLPSNINGTNVDEVVDKLIEGQTGTTWTATTKSKYPGNVYVVFDFQSDEDRDETYDRADRTF